MSSFALGSLPPPPDPRPGTDRARTVGQSALGLVGIGAVLLAGRAVSLHAPACPFRSLTGVPCPGCGMTRLADTLAHGHIATAVRADAAGVALLGVIAVLALIYLVQVTIKKRTPPAWMSSAFVPAVLGALVAIHWITTIVTGGLASP